MGEENLSLVDGWMSDDSSFYGDEDEQKRLLTLCDDFNPSLFWKTHSKDLNVVAAKARSKPARELFNSLQNCASAWQIGESVDDFISRLPPCTTSNSTCKWIWAANPYRDGTKSGVEKIKEFKARGALMLEESRQRRDDIKTTNSEKPKSSITRLLNQESRSLEQRITDLASETNVIYGKWMLFPTVEDVTRVWRMVVEAVINDRLGPRVKVAPDDGSSRTRMICIYTKDFRDQSDVLRVLQELLSMNVVNSRNHIYYKSDPYTWLDIYRDSAAKYGLQASLYSSKKMLAEARFANPKSASLKK